MTPEPVKAECPGCQRWAVLDHGYCLRCREEVLLAAVEPVTPDKLAAVSEQLAAEATG